jgi:antirestriction protein
MTTIQEITEAITWQEDDAVKAYFDLVGGDTFDDAQEFLDQFEEAFQGAFTDDEAFARDMAENVGYVHAEGWPGNCIDWELAARELMYDYNEQDGYYFRAL